MNISSEIFTHGSISSDYLDLNGTEVETDFEMASVIYIVGLLLTFPTNSYVIWLIVTGTGNGLAAEFFSLNLSVCEILISLETILILLSNKVQISRVGLGFMDGLGITGRPLFQCLICVERYLAVVHPVTFLKFKPLRYRVMCSAVSWLAVFASGGFICVIWMFIFETYLYYLIVLFLLFLSIQLFCCVSVLRALKQSGPGERGREREEENHMKRRAFHLILITAVALVIIYVTYIILIFVPTSDNLFTAGTCISQFCFIVAGLVQPVLFLCRVERATLVKCHSFYQHLHPAAICK